jgi:enoyl-CoA hydratase/carnithine racemase
MTTQEAVTYEQILTEVDGPVALVTLNRPERMNAWTWQMSTELTHAFNVFDADDSIRAIVVTGAGKAFCAGADLVAGGGGDTFSGRGLGDRRELAERYAGPRKGPNQLSTPIIAAINGAAVGAGLTMPIEWDLRIAADDAKLGFVFNRRGVMPDADLLWYLPKLIGLSRALDLLLTARIFDGKLAEEWGLVSRSVAKDEVVPTALEMARDIATNVGPVSAAITKQLAYRFLNETNRTEALRFQSELFGWTGRQADAKEGIMAFMEKRDPDWKLSKTRDLPEQLQDRRE